MVCQFEAGCGSRRGHDSVRVAVKRDRVVSGVRVGGVRARDGTAAV